MASANIVSLGDRFTTVWEDETDSYQGSCTDSAVTYPEASGLLIERMTPTTAMVMTLGEEEAQLEGEVG